MAACEEKGAAASYLLSLSTGESPLLQHQHEGKGTLMQLYQKLRPQREREQYNMEKQQSHINDEQHRRQEQGKNRDALFLEKSTVVHGAAPKLRLEEQASTLLRALAAASKTQTGPSNENIEDELWEEASDLSMSEEDITVDLHNSNSKIHTSYRSTGGNLHSGRIREKSASSTTREETRRRSWDNGISRSNRRGKGVINSRDAFQSLDSPFLFGYNDRQALLFGREGKGRRAAANTAAKALALASLAHSGRRRRELGQLTSERKRDNIPGNIRKKLSNKRRGNSISFLTDPHDANSYYISSSSTRGSNSSSNSSSSTLLSRSHTTCGGIADWDVAASTKVSLPQSSGSVAGSSWVSEALGGINTRENGAAAVAANAELTSPCNSSSNSRREKAATASAASGSAGDNKQGESDKEETRRSQRNLTGRETPVAEAAGLKREESHLNASAAVTLAPDTTGVTATAALEADPVEGKGVLGKEQATNNIAGALVCEASRDSCAAAAILERFAPAAKREREQKSVTDELASEIVGDPAATNQEAVRDGCVEEASEKSIRMTSVGNRRQQHHTNRRSINSRRARVLADAFTEKKINVQHTSKQRDSRDSGNTGMDCTTLELFPWGGPGLLHHDSRDAFLRRNLAVAAEESKRRSGCSSISHSKKYGSNKSSSSRREINSKRCNRGRKPDDSKKKKERGVGDNPSSNRWRAGSSARLSTSDRVDERYFQNRDIQDWRDIITSMEETEELENEFFDEAYADLLDYDLNAYPWMPQAPGSFSSSSEALTLNDAQERGLPFFAGVEEQMGRGNWGSGIKQNHAKLSVAEEKAAAEAGASRRATATTSMLEYIVQQMSCSVGVRHWGTFFQLQAALWLPAHEYRSALMAAAAAGRFMLTDSHSNGQQQMWGGEETHVFPAASVPTRQQQEALPAMISASGEQQQQEIAAATAQHQTEQMSEQKTATRAALAAVKMAAACGNGDFLACDYYRRELQRLGPDAFDTLPEVLQEYVAATMEELVLAASFPGHNDLK